MIKYKREQIKKLIHRLRDGHKNLVADYRRETKKLMEQFSFNEAEYDTLNEDDFKNYLKSKLGYTEIDRQAKDNARLVYFLQVHESTIGNKLLAGGIVNSQLASLSTKSSLSNLSKP